MLCLGVPPPPRVPPSAPCPVSPAPPPLLSTDRLLMCPPPRPLESCKTSSGDSRSPWPTPSSPPAPVLRLFPALSSPLVPLPPESHCCPLASPRGVCTAPSPSSSEAPQASVPTSPMSPIPKTSSHRLHQGLGQRLLTHHPQRGSGSSCHHPPMSSCLLPPDPSHPPPPAPPAPFPPAGQGSLRIPV